MKLLRLNTSGNDLLFKKLPQTFGKKDKELFDCIKEAKRFYDGFLVESSKILAEDVKEILGIGANKRIFRKMSLSSVIKDWIETLDPAVFEQLFADGTERALELFSSVTNDDYKTVSSLARITTDLRLEDWDEKTKELFVSNIKNYRKTAEEFKPKGRKEQLTQQDSDYQITFTDNEGNLITKRFDRVEDTKKGKLLHNQVTAALDSMGRAMSDQEKRQVLVEILKDLC